MILKAVHITITFMLLIATTGMAVSKHFCDEMLVSTTLYADSESCCNDQSCCHNESEFIQLDEDFQPAQSAQLPVTPIVELMTPMDLSDRFSNSEHMTGTAFSDRKPPTLYDTHTFLSLKQSYLL